MSIQFWFATIVFIVSFVAVATEKIHKTTAVLIGSAIMLLFILPGPVSHMVANSSSMASEIVSPHLGSGSVGVASLDTYANYVNFDVIFTLAGMMILVNILSGTGIFQYIAIKSAKFAKGNPTRTMILLVVSTAVLSAFLDNVTTVLLIAPITFIVASELDVPVLPFLMAETLASNIGGAATLIGDPPNLLIGSAAGLNFMAFIYNLAPFIVVLMIIYCFFLRRYYKTRMKVTVEKRAKIMELDELSAITDFSNLKRAGFVVVVTLIGFLIHGAVGLQPSVIAMSGADLALGVCKVNVDKMLEKIEWSTLFFFIGLFILVEGAEYVGLISRIGHLLDLTSGWNPLCIILVLMWFCGIIVAFMNNVSFTAVAISVVGGFLTTSPLFSGNPQLQRLLWWGLALAVCLGGNFTIIGAAANLVTAGVAEQAGNKISFKEFMKYGIPVSFASLVLSSIYISLRYFLIQS
ncbi:MAG TPA: ArsB/NhaD family transporter [Victivallales bacterium]|nr:ArsB/NhaD family transporter [Victivallales bacterium]